MKKPSFLKCRNSQLAPLFVLLAMTINAHADSATWNGVDGAWSTLSNWSGPPAAVPGATDTATFGATGYVGTSLTPILPGDTVTINNILFNGSAQDYFIGGTVNLSAGGAITTSNGSQTFVPGTAGTPSVYAAGSANVTNNGAGILSLGINSGTAGSTLTFGGTGSITTTSPLAAGGNTTTVVKNGAGTLTLGNYSNTNIQGGFTINAGTVIGLNANSFSNRNLTIAGGTTVQMNASGAASAYGNTAGTGVTVGGDTTLFYNVNTSQWRLGQTSGQGFFSTSSGSSNPTVTFKTAGGSGNVQLYLNNTNFNGTWKLGDEGVVAVNHVVSANGGNIRMNMGDAASTGRHIVQSGTILAVEGATQNIVPVLFGELSGTNTTSRLSGKTNVSTRTTGTQFVVGGLGTNSSYAGSISDGVTTTGTAQSNGAVNGTGTYARTSGVAGSQGTTEFVKTGSGVLTLTGASTHTGGTVIQGGTLGINSDAALGAGYTGSLRVFSYIPGTGVYSNTDLPDTQLNGGGGSGAVANVYSSVFNTNANNNLFLSFSNQANDSVASAITNTLTGTGYISVPTVSFTGGTLGTGTGPVASVRVQGLLTLDGGTLQTDAGITSNRAIVLGAGNGTINTKTFDSTFSGIINGSGNLTISGSGKVTLSGANTYTGATVISGGTLALDASGSIGSSSGISLAGGTFDVSAKPGYTLNNFTGIGNVIGALTVSNTFAIGSSPGTANFNGNLTLGAASTYLYELNGGAAPGAGSADLGIVAGDLAIIDGSKLDLVQLGTYTAGNKFTLFGYTGTLTGTFRDAGGASLADGGSFSGAGGQWLIDYNDPTAGANGGVGTSFVTIIAVPEPGVAILGSIGLLALLRRRRA